MRSDILANQAFGSHAASDVLVLLTASYPFGRKAETFLDAELPVLARHFRQIFVVPSKEEEHERRLPDRVECVRVLVDDAPGRGARVVSPLAARQVLRAVFEESNSASYLRHARTYLRIAQANALKYRRIRRFISDYGLSGALFYDYWLENSTLALAWLRRAGLVRRAVARAHGFDVYDDRWETGAVPFRAFKLTQLDRVFAISSHAMEYLGRRTNPDGRTKLVLSRLGARAPAQVPTRERSATPPLVVSCGSLNRFKRVHEIPRVLSLLGSPLRWVHFGDGPMRQAVEDAARLMPSRVAWELRGHVDHERLLEFYGATPVDAFLSLSSSEGLPVSMMEAIACGTPVVATNAGGVAELVTPATGALLGERAALEEIAAALRRILDGGGPPADQVRAFFAENFDAERNFEAFAEMLHAV